MAGRGSYGSFQRVDRLAIPAKARQHQRITVPVTGIARRAFNRRLEQLFCIRHPPQPIAGQDRKIQRIGMLLRRLRQARQRAARLPRLAGAQQCQRLLQQAHISRVHHPDRSNATPASRSNR